MSSSLNAFIAIPLAGIAVACATPGTKPDDMSIAAHEAAASAAPGAAAEHLAAAAALRDAEARACDGIPDGERDASPFASSQVEIEKVAPLYRPGPRRSAGRPTVYEPELKLAGALVTLRTSPDVSTDQLERRLDCHVARNRAAGHAAAAMQQCPLSVAGVVADVRIGHEGRFIVALHARDQAAADEIFRRTGTLVSETDAHAKDDMSGHVTAHH